MPENVKLHCRNIFERISDFIDGDAEPEVCREIENHLRGCVDCGNFIDSVKKTVELYSRDKTPMPEEARARLHGILEEQCKTLKKQKKKK